MKFTLNTRHVAAGLVAAALATGGLTATASSASAAGALAVETVKVKTAGESAASRHSGFLTGDCFYGVTFTADTETPMGELGLKATSPDQTLWNYTGPGSDGRKIERLDAGRYYSDVPCEYARENWTFQAVRYDADTRSELEASPAYSDFTAPGASDGPMRVSLSPRMVRGKETLYTGQRQTITHLGDEFPANADVTTRVWTSAERSWSAADLEANRSGSAAVLNDVKAAATTFTIPEALTSRWVWVSIRVVEEGKRARIIEAGPFATAGTQPASWVKSYGSPKTTPKAGRKIVMSAPKLSSAGRKADPSFTYTWMVGKKELATKSSPRYRVPGKLKGKMLSVKVKSLKPSYTTRSKMVKVGRVK